MQHGPAAAPLQTAAEETDIDTILLFDRENFVLPAEVRDIQSLQPGLGCYDEYSSSKRRWPRYIIIRM